ncbi:MULTISPECIES: 16S rRNA (guanine(966)-N(2))-methyltransferase RsmD [Enterocloster]|nr:16S rRNA (guanine(966)-N(2))-methyltransferase RsmD [Enterocloster sp.]MDR3757614.1 16S rRNA (guanine(966)-N(2))-methyltransferase RsmD [Enterocloster sp.]PST34023.1 16S rRNA (guanine(966)-N(2))-methyltransferase RsmD [Enterocloster lavalensis]
MRVIAGSARRLLLKTMDGLDTRPTTDRIKETLFNMLQPSIPDCMFLDLFSGSGAIGIEALSRGASLAVLVENNPKAVECIRENLSRTKLEDRAVVMGNDVISSLRKLEGKNYVFDIIFMDPPYNKGWEQQVLTYLSGSPMADENTTIVIEAAKETDFGWLTAAGYDLIRSKEYKTNKHVFVAKGEKHE